MRRLRSIAATLGALLALLAVGSLHFADVEDVIEAPPFERVAELFERARDWLRWVRA